MVAISRLVAMALRDLPPGISSPELGKSIQQALQDQISVLQGNCHENIMIRFLRDAISPHANIAASLTGDRQGYMMRASTGIVHAFVQRVLALGREEREKRKTPSAIPPGKVFYRERTRFAREVPFVAE